MNITTLEHVTGNVYCDVKQGREPYFTEHLENGQLIYMHETGYGYLPADRVRLAALRADQGGEK